MQETEPLPDFLENAVANQMLPIAQLDAGQEIERIGHRFTGQLGDVDPPYRHRQALLAQPLAVTFRTRHLAHIGFQLFPHPVAGGFFVAALQIVENALEFREVFAVSVFLLSDQLDFLPLGPIEENIDDFLRQILDGRIK